MLCRLPAEWERQEAVLLSWPHVCSDWSDILSWVNSCYVEIAVNISRYAKVIIVAPDTGIPRNLLKGKCDIDKIHFVDIPTNDTWARDFGPLTVEIGNKKALLDFCFNGWGLKFASDKDNLVTQCLEINNVFVAECFNHRGFVLEGGSIESDGQGTILTTAQCLLSPNRNAEMTREDIEHHLIHAFGANHFLWLENGALEGDDTDSHIDTLARLAPDNTIVYVTPPSDSADPHFESLTRMQNELQQLRNKDGEPFRLVGLPFATPVYDSDNNRLPATYANYLPLNKAVLVPLYNDSENDNIALETIKTVFPDRDIIGIDCTALIQQHGSLHCATMQLPYGVINSNLWKK